LTESAPSGDPGSPKRRSTRIVQAVPITVTGVDALGQPFKERTATVSVNCHGCKYQSKHYVPKNSTITVEIPQLDSSTQARVLPGQVIWVQRPRTVRELFQIGLEFEMSGNVWGVAFPPEDWFPCAGEDAAARTAEQSSTQGKSPARNPAAPNTELAGTASAKPSAPSAPSGESKIFVVPNFPSQTAELADARQMAKMVADAKETLEKTIRKGAQTAINEEMTIVRQQLDAQLHETVERAIKVSMERVSESSVKKVVQQAADRTAALVEQARKAAEQSTQQLDDKVRHAVEDAAKQAAEHAAQDAIHQTATQNLQQAVEEAIERALAERGASAPSVEILASPEAAQQHIDQWRKSLEETAGSVRSAAIEQTQEDTKAATRQWKEEFDAALAGASEKLSRKMNEISQAALMQAEGDIAARSSNIRRSLEDVIVSAESMMQTLGTKFEQERARAEGAQTQLQEITTGALDEARRRMEEILASQSAEIGRQADQIISERIQHIEPALRDSARDVAQGFVRELDESLAPKIADVKNILSQVANAGEHAARFQNDLREQLARASEQAIEESLGRLKQEMGNYPAELEKSSREMLSKVEEELIQKSTEAQHTTYEALLRASEWYQKKAHTTMQASLEKAVEQSTGALRDHAAEISSLAASELDHHRRAHTEHGQAQMEEAAREVVSREREKLNEIAGMTSASFADRAQQASQELFRQFEQASRQGLEKARSDLEYDRQGSLAEFQKRLEEQILRGVQTAQTQLQSQAAELMQNWAAKHEAQQREWREMMMKSADESIEHYKARLENASNSWLLASATTLGQHSQAVLDALAKAAEKRLRESCGEVLARMGDAMKESLRDISSGFGGDEAPTQEKK